MRTEKKVRKFPNHTAEKKPLLRYVYPYRKPTQVDEGENPQADGRSVVKELGKMTP